MLFHFFICFIFLNFFLISNNNDNSNESKNIEEIKKYMIQKYHLNDTNKLKTFNQKIQWSKIFNVNPLRTLLVDKYLVRDWVKKKIGEKYLTKLLGVYNNFYEINFNILPNKFVIKCNHGSAMNVIVKNKKEINMNEIRKFFNDKMKINFGFIHNELQYVNVSRKIIIEEYMENENGYLNDCKIFCFNGKPHYILIDSDSQGIHRKMSFYDTNWNFINVTYDNRKIHNPPLKKPTNLNEILQIATILSQGFNHVRVDLYIFENQIIKFGEMTFTHCAGVAEWSDEKFNKHLGDLFELRVDKNIELNDTKKIDL